MEKKVPNIIYKFHKIGKHLYSLLENKALFFQHQSQLNDPFDCKYELTENYLITILKGTPKIKNDIIDRFPKMKELKEEDFWTEAILLLRKTSFLEDVYTMHFNNLGFNICSFTTNPSNELMWAYYADNHKGICLAFDFSNTPELHKKLCEVEYEDTLNKINSKEDVFPALLKKRKAWTHEKEWRMLLFGKDSIEFPKESLKEIYFGYYVGKKTIDDIRKRMTNYGYKEVKFGKMELNIDNTAIKPIYL